MRIVRRRGRDKSGVVHVEILASALMLSGAEECDGPDEEDE
jgi:hypothetical protein